MKLFEVKSGIDVSEDHEICEYCNGFGGSDNGSKFDLEKVKNCLNICKEYITE